jgi:hypothetical protein
LDFVIDQGAEEFDSLTLTLNYIQLKVLLIDGEDLPALDYYRHNIPSYYSLTSQEYFRLGSVVIGSIFGTMSDGQKDQLRHEGLNLLHKSYQQNNSDKNDAKRLILKMLLDKGGVRIDFEGDEAEVRFQEFLDDIAKQEESKSEEIKIHLAKLEGIRIVRSNQTQSTSSGATSSFFSQSNEAVIHPELIFIDTIISNLKKGHSLAEQLKDPGIKSGLADYSLLDKLIRDEMKVTISQDDDSMTQAVH